MLFVISAVGAVGALILGLGGLMRGSAGQLELIAAIACFALAAAGVVGLLADDGRRDHTRAETRRALVGHPNVLHVVAVAPIMALSVGVFLATLIPAVFVMLPFLAAWYLVSGATAQPAREGAPATGHYDHPLQFPAYP